jgi:hypothetical protein
MARTSAPAAAMVEQIGRAIAEADGVSFEHDSARFKRWRKIAIEAKGIPRHSAPSAPHMVSNALAMDRRDSAQRG